MATTTGSSPARCLDLTRLISRVGRGPLTGIDRVEFEYLTHLLTEKTPLFGLIRVAPGFALLDQAGMQQIAERLTGETNWGPPDALSRLRRKTPHQQRRANADIRRLSVALGRRKSFGKSLQQHLPAGTAYFNVGHSNLSADLFTAIRSIANANVNILIHDTIPLDFPQYQRQGSVDKFEAKLRFVQKNADQIITISKTAAKDISRQLPRGGRAPDIVVAPLGVTVTHPQKDELAMAPQSYFVSLGTIEPRKNHSLLLDIWDKFGKSTSAPHLYIVGQRGWNNRVVFDRLDSKPPNITELNNLSDAAVTALLADAKALLFPSHAEGFGLPIAEAMALNTPVICNNLPVFHELFGNYPVYADAADMYSWEKAIKEYALGSENPIEQRQKQASEMAQFCWDEHFNIVLNRT